MINMVVSREVAGDILSGMDAAVAKTEESKHYGRMCDELLAASKAREEIEQQIASLHAKLVEAQRAEENATRFYEEAKAEYYNSRLYKSRAAAIEAFRAATGN